MATHGNDRQYHVTGTDYVRLQTKDKLFDSGVTERVEKHGPSPAPSPSINFFLLFPRPARISSLPCSAVTSKLLFGYERLSGNRPFHPPPPPAARPLFLAVRRGRVEGMVQGLELKAGIITSAAVRACPLLVQKHRRVATAVRAFRPAQ